MSPNVVVAAGGHATRQFRLVKETRPPWPGFLFCLLHILVPVGASHQPRRYSSLFWAEGPQGMAHWLRSLARPAPETSRSG